MFLHLDREQLPAREAECEKAYGGMCGLVIDVDERAPDVGQDLYLILQALAEIVRLPEGRVRVHHDIDLDVVVLFNGQAWPAAKIKTRPHTGPLCNVYRQRLTCHE